MGSTIYWMQIRWLSRTSHNRTDTQHYSRRRRRRLYQWANQYDQWNNTSYTPLKEDKAEGSHTFNVYNRICHKDQTKKQIEDKNCQ